MSSLSQILPLIQRQIIQYMCSIYLIFGITGNILNIILLTRKQYRSVSCCIYFITLSILGLIILPIATSSFLHSLNYPDPFTTNTVFCKIRIYVLQVTGMAFRWCLVAACFDRCALTSSSARLRACAEVTIAYRVIGVIIIVWLLLPIHTLVYFSANGVRCYALGNRSVAIYQGLYSIITGNILPVTIMIVCSILTRRNLTRQYERHCRFVPQSSNNNIQIYRKHIQQIFPMLLFQVVLYIITQTPWLILNIYATATMHVTNKSIDRLVIEKFLRFLTEIILYPYVSLPFYLFTLASHAYRDELFRLLYYLFKCPWRNNTNRIKLTSRICHEHIQITREIEVLSEN